MNLRVFLVYLYLYDAQHAYDILLVYKPLNKIDLIFLLSIGQFAFQDKFYLLRRYRNRNLANFDSFIHIHYQQIVDSLMLVCFEVLRLCQRVLANVICRVDLQSEKWFIEYQIFFLEVRNFPCLLNLFLLAFENYYLKG